MMMMKNSLFAVILASVLVSSASFVSPATVVSRFSKWGVADHHRIKSSSTSHHYQCAQQRRLHLNSHNLFDKMFEEEGPLGKGITVGKFQLALIAEGRGDDSIFGSLERNAVLPSDDSAEGLAEMTHEVCMSLLRKKDDWTAASSDSRWFSANDYGKAESQYNDWANTEAAKFEKVCMHELLHGT
jgi:hypothetical protein